MKTLKIVICSLFVVCCGFIFSACREKKNFNVEAINISNQTEFTYDGQSHVVGVSYNGVNANVTYALDSNAGNFMSANELNLVNAGTYNIYYRLSAKGYNDFISSETLTLTITPRSVDVVIFDKQVMKSDWNGKLEMPKKTNGILEGVTSDSVIKFDYVEDVETNDIVCGSSYEITCSSKDPNYVVTCSNARLTVLDYCHIQKSDTSKTYYSNLRDALANAETGETIVLNSNIVLYSPLTIDKDITIDGCNKYKIQAASNFATTKYQDKKLTSIFNLFDNSAKLNLKDVTIDGCAIARVVSAFSGNVNINGAKIQNGNCTDDFNGCGVFITNNATFNMISGEIKNVAEQNNAYDVWIASNTASTEKSSIKGGTVGKLLVSANSFTSTENGMLTQDGGTIENMYVEYNNDLGAQFKYKTGTINHLFVSMKNDIGNYYGEFLELPVVTDRTYIGGQLVYEQTSYTISEEIIYENITDLEYNKQYIFENCVFNVPISITDRVGLVFNGCTFITDGTKPNLYVTSATQLVVNNCEFEGDTTNVKALDINLYSTTCQQIYIANNSFNTTVVGEGKSYAIAVKTRLGATDFPSDDEYKNSGSGYKGEGVINNCVVIAGNNFNETNNRIEFGINPENPNSTPNTSTGNFDAFLDKNNFDLTVYSRFKDNDPNGAEVLATKSTVYSGASRYFDNKK